jgi:hypothetical protein
MTPANPADLILLTSAPIAVATTAKSLSIDPPKKAIPEKRLRSAIPFLSPKKARDKPIMMAKATPGIFLLKSVAEILNETHIMIPTNRKANNSPFFPIS